jgi:hypothetical protein
MNQIWQLKMYQKYLKQQLNFVYGVMQWMYIQKLQKKWVQKKKKIIEMNAKLTQANDFLNVKRHECISSTFKNTTT